MDRKGDTLFHRSLSFLFTGQFKYTHPQFSTYVVDTDCGCGVILNNKDKSSIPLDLELNYENLVLNRDEWLNLISVNEFKKIFK